MTAPAIQLEVHTRICRKCFKADMVEKRHVSGYHNKTAMTKTDYQCTACGCKKVGHWEYRDIKTYLDVIELGLAQLDQTVFRFAIRDVHSRVTDFLLGGGKENDHYLQQQYVYVCNLLKAQDKMNEERQLAYT